MSKEKGKSHPFAGHLQDTEEILWMATREDGVSWQQALRAGISLVIVATIFVLFLLTTKRSTAVDDLIILIVVVFIILFLCVPAVGLLIWLMARAEHPAPQVYAVTSERLLYRIEEEVKTIALDNIRSVSVFPGRGTKGTLSFGPEFPMWADVENAVAVKQLIEAAKAELT